MFRTLFGPGVVLLALTSWSATASDTDTKRQLDSHEHGHATLNVAVDDDHLLIEFESPAANIVGFEHEPKNHEQEEAIEKAEKDLANGMAVFVLPAAAGCTLDDADIEAPHEGHHDEHHDEKHADKKHDDEKHDEHKHDDEKHAEEKHDEHKHGDEKHADEEGEVHSEFHATWKFECKSIGKLDTIDVRLFEMFPDTEEIDASIIGPKGQSGSELTANATLISL